MGEIKSLSPFTNPKVYVCPNKLFGTYIIIIIILLLSSHLFHGVDLLVDELGLGQQRIGCCVVFFKFGRQSLGVGQYLLYGDRHRTEAL